MGTDASSDTANRAHQPGQTVFRSMLPEDVAWGPFAAFPPEASLRSLRGIRRSLDRM